MEQIATYSEIRFDGSRTFTLFPDRIVVKGKQTFHSDFESNIPLATLDSNYDCVRIRNRIFIAGVWIAIISFIMFIILLTGLKIPFTEFSPGIILSIGVAGLILSAATYRKVEFLRFRNKAGLIVLDIARSGKHADEFDTFVDTLINHIEHHKEQPKQSIEGTT